MTYFESILLGALQGVTEFLPVSSSGHLVVMRSILQLKDIPLLFDVLLHMATLLVVIIIFRKRIGSIIISLYRFAIRKNNSSDIPNLKLTGVILFATLLTGVVGFGASLLEVNQYPKIVSGLFIITGIILLLTGFAKPVHGYNKIGVKEGLLTGIAQGIGVLPGISRSGITISAALFAGMNREKAGEYSFLLSIPAVSGALILTLKDSNQLFSVVDPGVLAAGVVSSFIVGIFSLLLLLKLIKDGRLYIFSVYLIPLGIAGVFIY